MKKFIQLSKSERKNVIQKLSNDLGLRFDIVEKDIWVCYVLEKLFSNEKLKDNLIFKGGTCLSKAYNAIARFSEDIDITINKNILNFENKSNKTEKIIKRTRKAAREFIEAEIFQYLDKVFTKELGRDNYSLIFDETDKVNITLLFQFSYSENLTFWDEIYWDQAQWSDETGSYRYIKPKIKLEFGALGGTEPTVAKTVKPYGKDILPDYFNEFEVNTLDIKRNFIEKLLILHSIYCRPVEKKINHNYSRHYYDVYAIIKNGLKINTKEDLEILKLVVENKKEFWNESWINYENIQAFSDIKLIPNEAGLIEIKKDYKNMEEMFFKDFPSFEEMMEGLREFEKMLKIR